MHTIAQQAGLPAVSPAALLRLSDERDMWQARELAAEKRGFARGFATGMAEGARRQEDADTTRQRIVADHIVRVALGPAYAQLLVRRWAPRGWRGRVPEGMSTHEARLWLARQPRRGDYRPGPVSAARIAKSWAGLT